MSKLVAHIDSILWEGVMILGGEETVHTGRMLDM